MIAIDANLLVYAVNTKARQHGPSRKWLESALAEEPDIGLPVQSVAAFLRVMTTVGDKPLTIREAISHVEDWLALPNVRLLHQGERHWPLLKAILLRHRISGKRITDAQIVSTVIENGGAAVASADADYRWFEEVAWINPLAGEA